MATLVAARCPECGYAANIGQFRQTCPECKAVLPFRLETVTIKIEDMAEYLKAGYQYASLVWGDNGASRSPGC